LSIASLFRIWLVTSLLLLLWQSYGGGLPHDQSASFYIGYFGTPFFFGFLIALVAFLVFKYFQKRK
tara:strand:+ start:144 stop:341 length:198 start_codon:yes stop_codon:yes gene_type:complete